MPLDAYEVILRWQEFGFYDVILPLLLIFTLSFAILEKTRILGKNKKINVIISLVFGFLFLQNTFLVASLQTFLPNVSFFIIIFLMFFLLVGIFLGKDYEAYQSAALKWATGISIVVIIWALSAEAEFGLGQGSLLESLAYALGPDILPILLFLLVIGFIIFFVAGGDDEHRDGGHGGRPRG